MKFHIGYNLSFFKKFLFSILIGYFIFQSLIPTYAEEIIPEWIKYNAKWWAEDSIDNITYLNSIEYLINSGIIEISTFQKSNNDMLNIPEWIKYNAKWWAEDSIDNITYLNSIEYLINSGIIDFDTEKYDEKVQVNSGVPGIFKIWTWKNDIFLENGFEVSRNIHYSLIDEYENLYDEIGMIKKIDNVVVILPVFTSSAYSENGFYYYFRGECDSCTTTKLIQSNHLEFINASQTGAQILQVLGYPVITDIDVDKNPKILKDFETVIILHNEYVTKNEFDAITNHDNVIYLYPNALHAEISVDYDKKQITLIRGHAYPDSNIINGFDWEFDNTYPYEFDDECENWEFYDIDNGKMLNCYPEFKIVSDIELLKKIKTLVN